VIDLPLVARLAEIVATIFAWLLTRRRADHRPAAVALTVLLLADITSAPIQRALLPAPSAPYPVGRERILFHVATALFLLSNAVLPGLALAVCVEAKKLALGILAAVWAVVSVGCAALYPSPSVYGAGLARVYLATDLAGLFVFILSFVHWSRRHEGPTPAHIVTLIMAATDMVCLLAPYSPWRSGIFNRWDTAQFAFLLMFATLTLYQGVLWRSSKS
jgi:hypothetical protein